MTFCHLGEDTMNETRADESLCSVCPRGAYPGKEVEGETTMSRRPWDRYDLSQGLRDMVVSSSTSLQGYAPLGHTLRKDSSDIVSFIVSSPW